MNALGSPMYSNLLLTLINFLAFALMIVGHCSIRCCLTSVTVYENLELKFLPQSHLTLTSFWHESVCSPYSTPWSLTVNKLGQLVQLKSSFDIFLRSFLLRGLNLSYLSTLYLHNEQSTFADIK